MPRKKETKEVKETKKEPKKKIEKKSKEKEEETPSRPLRVPLVAGGGFLVLAMVIAGGVFFFSDSSSSSSSAIEEPRPLGEVTADVASARAQTASVLTSVYDRFRNGVGGSDVEAVNDIRTVRTRLLEAYDGATYEMYEDFNRVNRALTELETELLAGSLDAITYTEDALHALNVDIADPIDIESLRGTSTAATSTTATSTDEVSEDSEDDEAGGENTQVGDNDEGTAKEEETTQAESAGIETEQSAENSQTETGEMDGSQ